MAEKTGAHTGASGKPAFPPFQSETFASQLVWLAITFVALYLLMSRVALPRIGSIFEERRDRIADDLAEAQRLKDDSDVAIGNYEKALADARNRAQAMANETRERMSAEADERRKALEQQLNVKLAEAERTITATKTAAMTNVRGIAVDAAAAIVERLIGTAPAAASVEAAVDTALKR
jgi:F-type H+-transporting ATPase subunit b